MITHTKIAFLLLCLLAFRQSSAQEAPLPMSLQDCIDYAMKHSDTLKNVRLNILRQDAQNDQIRALALPRLSGQMQFQYYPNPQQALLPNAFFTGNPEDKGFTATPFVPPYGNTISLNASQPLFDGTLLVALKARNTIMEVVRMSAKLTEEGLKYQIMRAYYAIVIGQEQYRNISGFLATAREVANDFDVMYRAGVVEKIDVDRSNVQVNNLETDSLRTAALLETGEQGLKYLIGMEIDEPILLTDTSLTENLRQATELLTGQLDYARRTEYNLLNTALKLDQAQVRRYQLAAWPSLSLSVNSGLNYGSINFNDLTRSKNYNSYTLIGLSLNVPIFSGFQRTSQVREARINMEKTQNNIHQLRLALDFQAAQSQTTLKNALLAAEKQRRNVALSNTVLDLARRKFKAGVGSNLEVNQAQTDLLLSQNNYYNALLDVVNAQADVQRALGGL